MHWLDQCYLFYTAGSAQGDPCFLMSLTPNQRLSSSLSCRVSTAQIQALHHDCLIKLAVLPLLSAAGAVCTERVHPAGAGSGGLGLQTFLPASAGSGRELAVQPAGAHRSAVTTPPLHPSPPLLSNTCQKPIKISSGSQIQANSSVPKHHTTPRDYFLVVLYLHHSYIYNSKITIIKCFT